MDDIDQYIIRMCFICKTVQDKTTLRIMLENKKAISVFLKVYTMDKKFSSLSSSSLPVLSSPMTSF